MRLTKLMGLAVLLVAIAATMNALAFKTATVNNPTTLTVESTDSAIFAFGALTSGSGTGVSTSIVSGQLNIAISDLMQPNSEYIFADVFTIKSNVVRSSVNKNINITGVSVVDAAAGTPVSGITIDLLQGATTNAFTTATSTAANVGLKVTLGSGASLGGKSLLIKVTGQEQ